MRVDGTIEVVRYGGRDGEVEYDKTYDISANVMVDAAGNYCYEDFQPWGELSDGEMCRAEVILFERYDLLIGANQKESA